MCDLHKFTNRCVRAKLLACCCGIPILYYENTYSKDGAVSTYLICRVSQLIRLDEQRACMKIFGGLMEHFWTAGRCPCQIWFCQVWFLCQIWSLWFPIKRWIQSLAQKNYPVSESAAVDLNPPSHSLSVNSGKIAPWLYSQIRPVLRADHLYYIIRPPVLHNLTICTNDSDHL